MKKIVLSVFSVLVSFFGFLFATTTFAQTNSFDMIDISFCNDHQATREVDMMSQAGKVFPICVEFTNKSSTSIKINVEFLDSVITADSQKDRACNASDRPKTQFGNFVLPYTGETILAPQSTIQKTYDIKYPIGFSGLSHGCLAYNIIGADINDGSMFMVRVRAVKYLDILVSDSKVIQAVDLSQKPILKKVGDEYSISLGIKNNSNVDEKMHIKSTLSNLLGFKMDFTFDGVIPAQTGMIFTTKSFILPVYGGPFLFRSKIDYTPQFNFNITNPDQSPKIYAGGTKNLQNILFIWTRQSSLLVLILLACIGRIAHKFMKKKYK